MLRGSGLGRWCYFCQSARRHRPTELSVEAGASQLGHRGCHAGSVAGRGGGGGGKRQDGGVPDGGNGGSGQRGGAGGGGCCGGMWGTAGWKRAGAGCKCDSGGEAALREGGGGGGGSGAGGGGGVDGRCGVHRRPQCRCSCGDGRRRGGRKGGMHWRAGARRRGREQSRHRSVITLNVGLTGARRRRSLRGNWRRWARVAWRERSGQARGGGGGNVCAGCGVIREGRWADRCARVSECGGQIKSRGRVGAACRGRSGARRHDVCPPVPPGPLAFTFAAVVFRRLVQAAQSGRAPRQLPRPPGPVGAADALDARLLLDAWAAVFRFVTTVAAHTAVLPRRAASAGAAPLPFALARLRRTEHLVVADAVDAGLLLDAGAALWQKPQSSLRAQDEQSPQRTRLVPARMWGATPSLEKTAADGLGGRSGSACPEWQSSSPIARSGADPTPPAGRARRSANCSPLRWGGYRSPQMLCLRIATLPAARRHGRMHTRLRPQPPLKPRAPLSLRRCRTYLSATCVTGWTGGWARQERRHKTQDRAACRDAGAECTPGHRYDWHPLDQDGAPATPRTGGRSSSKLCRFRGSVPPHGIVLRSFYYPLGQPTAVADR
eukprot:scaffold8564_cov90-Isochrysis_galbana.AAC.3